jgi:hypothetical protein
VPYLPDGFAPVIVVTLVYRRVYPDGKFLAGQCAYQRFSEENHNATRAGFEARLPDTVKALFRKGNLAGKGWPSRTALVCRDGVWFGGTGRAPAVPRYADVLICCPDLTEVAGPGTGWRRSSRWR